MPKRLIKKEHPRSMVARERKMSLQDVELARQQQLEEDLLWEDTDKSVKKKQEKKEEQNRKREEQLTRKAEAKRLLEKEESESTTSSPMKLTRAKILPPQLHQHMKVVEPLAENCNRVGVEGLEARSVSEAISALCGDFEDRHPEKRRKAVFGAFERRRTSELKSKNPLLRMSQLKQMVFKEWQGSPENPMNKAK